MKIIIALALTLLTLSGCAKSVTDSGGGNISGPAPVIPKGNAVIPVMVTVFQVSFANHSVGSSTAFDSTPYTISQTMTITLPSAPLAITFVSGTNHPNLFLKLNSLPLCTYGWSGSGYVIDPTCNATGVVHSGDVLDLVGIPQGETVTIKFPYTL